MRSLVLLLAVLGLAACSKPSPLEKQLLVDAAALRAERVALDPSAPVENSLACLVALAPRDTEFLRPFEAPRDEEDKDPFLMGTETLKETEVLRPDEKTAARAVALAPWGEAVRACANARQVAFVRAAEPWNARTGQLGDVLAQAHALRNFTASRNAQLLADGKAAQVAAECVDVFGVYLDLSRVDAVIAEGSLVSLLTLARQCTRALDAAQPLPAPLAARWAALSKRVVTPAVLAEHTRLSGTIGLFGARLSSDARTELGVAKTEGDGSKEDWARWDEDARRLAKAEGASVKLLADQLSDWEIDHTELSGMTSAHPAAVTLSALVATMIDVARAAPTPVNTRARTPEGLDFVSGETNQQLR